MRKLSALVFSFATSFASAVPIDYLFYSNNPSIEVTTGDAAISTILSTSAVNANIHGSFTYDRDLLSGSSGLAISNFKAQAWAVDQTVPSTIISFYNGLWDDDGVSIGGYLPSEQSFGEYSLFFAELQFWQPGHWLANSIDGPIPSNLNFLADVPGFMELCFSGGASPNSCLRIHDITVVPAAVPLPSSLWLFLSALFTLRRINRGKLDRSVNFRANRA